MKVLVTGANGFLGSWLTKRLLHEGHTVSALVRKNSDLSELFDVKPNYVYGDVTDSESLKTSFKNQEVVFLAPTPDDKAGLESFLKKNLFQYQVIPNAFAVIKDYAPRKGRLPNATWIEWYRFMKPTPAGPMLKSPEEVLAECRTAGITPDKTVYLYCFKGARASNTFLALKEAGFKKVKMYFGSWNEWSRDPSLPIESGPTPLVS